MCPAALFALFCVPLTRSRQRMQTKQYRRKARGLDKDALSRPLAKICKLTFFCHRYEMQ